MPPIWVQKESRSSFLSRRLSLSIRLYRTFTRYSTVDVETSAALDSLTATFGASPTSAVVSRAHSNRSSQSAFSPFDKYRGAVIKINNHFPSELLPSSTSTPEYSTHYSVLSILSTLPRCASNSNVTPAAARVTNTVRNTPLRIALGAMLLVKLPGEV